MANLNTRNLVSRKNSNWLEDDMAIALYGTDNPYLLDVAWSSQKSIISMLIDAYNKLYKTSIAYDDVVAYIDKLKEIERQAIDNPTPELNLTNYHEFITTDSGTESIIEWCMKAPQRLLNYQENIPIVEKVFTVKDNIDTTIEINNRNLTYYQNNQFSIEPDIPIGDIQYFQEQLKKSSLSEDEQKDIEDSIFEYKKNFISDLNHCLKHFFLVIDEDSIISKPAEMNKEVLKKLKATCTCPSFQNKILSKCINNSNATSILLLLEYTERKRFIDLGQDEIQVTSKKEKNKLENIGETTDSVESVTQEEVSSEVAVAMEETTPSEPSEDFMNTPVSEETNIEESAESNSIEDTPIEESVEENPIEEPVENIPIEETSEVVQEEVPIEETPQTSIEEKVKDTLESDISQENGIEEEFPFKEIQEDSTEESQEVPIEEDGIEEEFPFKELEEAPVEEVNEIQEDAIQEEIQEVSIEEESEPVEGNESQDTPENNTTQESSDELNQNENNSYTPENEKVVSIEENNIKEKKEKDNMALDGKINKKDGKSKKMEDLKKKMALAGGDAPLEEDEDINEKYDETQDELVDDNDDDIPNGEDARKDAGEGAVKPVVSVNLENAINEFYAVKSYIDELEDRTSAGNEKVVHSIITNVAPAATRIIASAKNKEDGCVYGRIYDTSENKEEVAKKAANQFIKFINAIFGCNLKEDSKGTKEFEQAVATVEGYFEQRSKKIVERLSGKKYNNFQEAYELIKTMYNILKDAIDNPTKKIKAHIPEYSKFSYPIKGYVLMPASANINDTPVASDWKSTDQFINYLTNDTAGQVAAIGCVKVANDKITYGANDIYKDTRKGKENTPVAPWFYLAAVTRNESTKATKNDKQNENADSQNGLEKANKSNTAVKQVSVSIVKIKHKKAFLVGRGYTNDISNGVSILHTRTSSSTDGFMKKLDNAFAVACCNTVIDKEYGNIVNKVASIEAECKNDDNTIDVAKCVAKWDFYSQAKELISFGNVKPADTLDMKDWYLTKEGATEESFNEDDEALQEEYSKYLEETKTVQSRYNELYNMFFGSIPSNVEADIKKAKEKIKEAGKFGDTEIKAIAINESVAELIKKKADAYAKGGSLVVADIGLAPFKARITVAGKEMPATITYIVYDEAKGKPAEKENKNTTGSEQQTSATGNRNRNNNTNSTGGTTATTSYQYKTISITVQVPVSKISNKYNPTLLPDSDVLDNEKVSQLNAIWKKTTKRNSSNEKEDEKYGTAVDDFATVFGDRRDITQSQNVRTLRAYIAAKNKAEKDDNKVTIEIPTYADAKIEAVKESFNTNKDEFCLALEKYLASGSKKIIPDELLVNGNVLFTTDQLDELAKLYLIDKKNK